MTTALKTIEAARNPKFKAMSFSEIDASLNQAMASNTLPSMGTIVTKAMVDGFDAHAVALAQLFIEYHLHRTELADALDFANDYHEMMA